MADQQLRQLSFLPWESLDPYFAAVVQATEEAIVNAMVAAQDMTGIDDHHVSALSHTKLREVLGKHVKQQGSLVAPDRLRFDFTHYAQVTRAELDQVEDLVNTQVLEDMNVMTEELARESGIPVDRAAFEAAMDEARRLHAEAALTLIAQVSLKHVSGQASVTTASAAKLSVPR